MDAPAHLLFHYIVWVGKQEVRKGILEVNGGKLEMVEEKSILQIQQESVPEEDRRRTKGIQRRKNRRTE